MKIAVVAANDFDGFPYGGTSALLRDLLSRLSQAHDCDLLLVGLSKHGASRSMGSSRVVGGRAHPFVSLAAVREGGRASVRKAMALGILKNISWIREHRPDVLYAHSPEIGLMLAMKAPRSPLVLHCHGVDNPMDLSRYPFARTSVVRLMYEKLVLAPALKCPRRVLVNADPAQYALFLQHVGADRQRFERVPPSIDSSLFGRSDRNGAREKWDIPTDAAVGIFTGRLEPPKGVDLLIRAAAEVRRANSSFELLVVGDGSARQTLENLAQSLGNGAGIRFIGRRERHEVASLLQAADLFLSGSVREAISMALLEAIGSGLPAVVTEAGGAHELIEDGLNGFVLSERDPTKMAGKIHAVLENRAGMSLHSSMIASRFSEKRVADQVHDALTGAAESAGSPNAGWHWRRFRSAE